MDYSFEIILCCRVRIINQRAHVILSNGAEAIMWLHDLRRLAADYPRGKLWFNSNGKKRSYVRLKPREQGARQNLIVSRIIAGWHHGGDLIRRTVGYLDGDTLNLRGENLVVSMPGRNRATDRTHQETARREWSIRNADGKILQNKPAPPLKRSRDLQDSPVPPKGGPRRTQKRKGGE